MSEYKARAARDAETMGYGDKPYWDYLERHAHALSEFFKRKGQTEKAEEMLTRRLADALDGKDGE